MANGQGSGSIQIDVFHHFPDGPLQVEVSGDLEAAITAAVAATLSGVVETRYTRAPATHIQLRPGTPVRKT